MATKIESELLKATGLKKAASESNSTYLERLTRSVSSVDDKVWEDLSTEAQKWANSAIDAIRDKKPLPPFPDAEPEDEEPAEEAPRRRATRNDDEEEAPAPKRKADKDDDEEEDPPAPKRNKDAEAEEEPAEEDPPAPAGKKEKDMKTKKRSTVDDEPADEAPETKPSKGKGGKGKAAKDESKSESKPKKDKSGGGGVLLTRKIVIKHPNKTLEAVEAEVKAKFPDTSKGTIQATRSMTRATLRLIPEYADKVK